MDKTLQMALKSPIKITFTEILESIAQTND